VHVDSSTKRFADKIKTDSEQGQTAHFCEHNFAPSIPVKGKYFLSKVQYNGISTELSVSFH